MGHENAKSIGQVQRKLEAAMEHFNVVWGDLSRNDLLPEPIGEWSKHDPYRVRRWPISSFAYSLAAAHNYVASCHNGMQEFVGTTEGQLCPYEDCAHDLAIELAGWCKCGYCHRPFFVRDTDSDFEDYYCRRPKADEEIPQALLFCRDLGPSWASPS